jgi:hypothetical protein
MLKISNFFSISKIFQSCNKEELTDLVSSSFSKKNENNSFFKIKSFFNFVSGSSHSLGFIYFVSKKQYLISNFFNPKIFESNQQIKPFDEIVLKNCEQIPEFFLCDFFEDLLNQNPSYENNLKKVKGSINNWYSQKNYKLSTIREIKISENREKISYYFKMKEPKIKSFVVIDKKKKLKNFSQQIKTILFSNILGFSIGHLFRIDTEAWERIKISNGISFADFSVNDYDLGDFGSFVDITMEISKVPSLAIEPEITFTDNQISSSLNFTEKNVLGTGISVKQKIFLKKFNPRYMSFEINNKSSGKPKMISIFGKYLKNFFSLGIVFKKFQNIEKTRFYKLSFGSECFFSKNSINNNLSSNFYKSSFTLSDLNLLKNHCFFNYFSLERFSELFETKNSLILNSVINFNFKKSKVRGLILTLENNYYKTIKLLNGKRSEKNQFYQSIENKLFVSPIQKFISLNTILSKNLNILITLHCFDNIGYDYNLLKKFEIKLEIGKIVTFSLGMNNYGKFKISLN